MLVAFGLKMIVSFELPGLAEPPLGMPFCALAGGPPLCPLGWTSGADERRKLFAGARWLTAQFGANHRLRKFMPRAGLDLREIMCGPMFAVPGPRRVLRNLGTWG